MKSELRRVHFTKSQLRIMAVGAQHLRAIMSRGAGKTVGVGAPLVSRNMVEMEQSLGAIEGVSFSQLLTRTLPPLIRGFTRLGLEMNKDFVVREKPRAGWPMPLFTPLDWHNTLAFRNGSAALLVSQQVTGSANGPSIDWHYSDEAKFLNKEQHDEELMPAMRANIDKFGHLSCHQSTCFITDMPTSPSQEWILQEEQLMDEDSIDFILTTQNKIGQLRRAIRSGSLAASSIRVYESQIATMNAQINEARKGTVYFTMANIMDNIEALGEPYVHRLKQLLPDYLFRTSVLNLRPDRVVGGFYPDLDDDKHTYVAGESAYVYQAGNELFTQPDLDDCRKDGDLIPGLVLEAGPDFGASFNCLVVGQLFDKEFNIINQVFVKHPGKIRHLAQHFHAYYKYHSPRRIRIYFDHTMIGEDAVREYGFITDLKRELEELGWEVEIVYIGAAMGHHEKYVFWGQRFAHVDSTLPRVRWNRINCDPTLQSMRMAKAKQTKNRFEKNKDAERIVEADQSKTTHLSDANDVLVIGRFLTLDSGEGSVDTVYS